METKANTQVVGEQSDRNKTSCDALPEPLIPSDVDVADMPGFVVDVRRLLASDLFVTGRREDRWTAWILYCRAYLQNPAGSLPDDDYLLAGFAGYDLKSWRKGKGTALRGWVKCSDGRLYHPVLAKFILKASEAKGRYKAVEQTGQAERQARWRKKQKEMSKRLREFGVNVPKGASSETLSRLLADAGDA